MAKIDLTNVALRFSIEGPIQRVNLAKQIGDSIYRHATNVEMDEFAKKLYHSKGAIEVNDQEAEWIRVGASEIAYFARAEVEKLLPPKK